VGKTGEKHPHNHFGRTEAEAMSYIEKIRINQGYGNADNRNFFG
jgi:hypothetical protein